MTGTATGAGKPPSPPGFCYRCSPCSSGSGRLRSTAQGGLLLSLRNSFRLLDPQILALAAASTAGWSVGVGYLATAPFLYTRVYELDADGCGFLFLGMSVATVAVGQTTGRVIIPRRGAQFALTVSVFMTEIGAFGVVVFALLGGPAGARRGGCSDLCARRAVDRSSGGAIPFHSRSRRAMPGASPRSSAPSVLPHLGSSCRSWAATQKCR